MLSDDSEEGNIEVKKSTSFQRLQMLHDSDTAGLGSLSSDDNAGVVSRCRTSASEASVRPTDGLMKDLHTSLQNLSTDDKICEHDECRKSVFVRSVPHSMTNREFRTFFSQFGFVTKARIMVNHRTKKSKGTGKVDFRSINDANAVLKLPREKLMVGDKVLRPVPNRCQRLWRYAKSPPKGHRRNLNVAHGISTNCTGFEMRDNETCDSSYINSLPSELLYHIFSFLTLKERIYVERVCKHWQRLNTSIPWVDTHELVFRKHFCNFGQPHLNSRILDEILRRCGATIRKLDFALCSHNLSDKFPIIISNFCPNLEEVNFQGMPVTNKSLKILSEECKKLKRVNLDACVGIGEKGLLWLLKNCRLESLSICQNHKITGSNFRFLSEEMRALNLTDCCNISFEGFELLAQCQNIRDLRLENVATIPSKSLIRVLECLGDKLVRLHLGERNENFTAETLLKSLCHCKKLRHLDLDNNYHVTDTVVEVISKHCRDMRILNLNETRFTDAGLIFLCNLPHLKTLHISYNCSITDTGVSKLSQNGLLEHLEMRGCAEISDNGSCPVISNCGQLQLLDLSSCPGVSDVTVTAAMTRAPVEGKKLKLIVGGTCVKTFVDNDNVEVLGVNLCPPTLHPWQFEMPLLDEVYMDGPLMDVQELMYEQMILQDAYELENFVWDGDEDNFSDDFYDDELYDEDLDEFV